MKEILIEESKMIQMDILTSVDKFCSEHGIRYSMACGTLLGAVRHGGFIPWDDDIDIYMLREDYNTFIQLFPERYEGKYSATCLLKNPQWHTAFAKIYDVRTLSIDINANITDIGINIDLFPIDDVPDDDTDWIKFRKKQLSIRRASSIKLTKLYPLKNLKIFFINSIRKIPYVLQSHNSIVNRLNNFAQINNGKGYQRVFEAVCGMYCKEPFKKSLFAETVDLKFEDRVFKAFKDADAYLTSTYGDYMQLPPIEKRIRKHETKDFWLD